MTGTLPIRVYDVVATSWDALASERHALKAPSRRTDAMPLAKTRGGSSPRLALGLQYDQSWSLLALVFRP